MLRKGKRVSAIEISGVVFISFLFIYFYGLCWRELSVRHNIKNSAFHKS